MDESTVGEVARLEKECFAIPWSLKGLREELVNPLAVFLVATLDGTVAGYAGMHHVLDEGYIANIAVGEAHRGRGVASALLDAFLTYARENQMTLLTLEVRPSNKAALALYAKYGFQEEGRRRDYYRNPTEDALLLTLRGFDPCG
jgi:ribosomal-protein-alanine N-acetyltransferase